MGIEVRPATVADHAAVRALAGELLAGMAPWRPAAGLTAAVVGWVDDACRGSADSVLLVADDGDSVLGFAGMSERTHFSGEREAYLGELVVSPAARRRGIAGRLVAAAEDWARHRGLGRVTLETGTANGPARELYARLGYVEEQVTLTRALG